MTMSPPVAVGDELPPFELPLTLQCLVMEAGVNRDFAPLHHDHELAKASGGPDVYANTMLLQAMIEAAVRNWMGPSGRLHRIDLSMNAYTVVGTVASAGGRVVDVGVQDRGRHADLEVWVDADGTRTVDGTAAVSWPPEHEDVDVGA